MTNFLDQRALFPFSGRRQFFKKSIPLSPVTERFVNVQVGCFNEAIKFAPIFMAAYERKESQIIKKGVELSVAYALRQQLPPQCFGQQSIRRSKNKNIRLITDNKTTKIDRTNASNLPLVSNGIRLQRLSSAMSHRKTAPPLMTFSW